jgi:hypothetical protein
MNVQEAVTGAISIRAYNVTDKFVADSRRRVDINLMSFYPSLCSNRYILCSISQILRPVG